MATEKWLEVEAFYAAADLTTKQYTYVKLDNTGKIVSSGAGEGGIGVLLDDPDVGSYGTVGILGQGKAVFGGAVTAGDNLTTDASGRLVTAGDGDVVVAQALENGATNTIHRIQMTGGAGSGANPRAVLQFHFKLAEIADGDLVTNYVPGFAGRIAKFSAVVTTPATTALKLSTLNLEVDTTNVTGGVLALTSANMTPRGKVVDATAITAGNTFGPTDSISIEASGTTAFVEGEIDLLIVLE